MEGNGSPILPEPPFMGLVTGHDTNNTEHLCEFAPLNLNCMYFPSEYPSSRSFSLFIQYSLSRLVHVWLPSARGFLIFLPPIILFSIVTWSHILVDLHPSSPHYRVGALMYASSFLMSVRSVWFVCPPRAIPTRASAPADVQVTVCNSTRRWCQ